MWSPLQRMQMWDRVHLSSEQPPELKRKQTWADASARGRFWPAAGVVLVCAGEAAFLDAAGLAEGMGRRGTPPMSFCHAAMSCSTQTLAVA